MNAIELLRNALARIAAAEEAIEDGDTGYAHAILTGLEADLASSVGALELEAA